MVSGKRAFYSKKTKPFGNQLVSVLKYAALAFLDSIVLMWDGYYSGTVVCSTAAFICTTASVFVCV